MTTFGKKMTGILFASGALLALVGCDKSEEKKPSDARAGATASNAPQSAAEIAKEASKVTIEPGEWETTTELADLKIEGAPKGMPADAMKSAMGRKTTIKTCITPEQAAKPNADFIAAQKDSKCSYSGFSMVGGTLSGTVSCPSPNGGKMTATMNGTYSPSSYAATMTMNMEGMQQGMKMVSTMKIASNRIGDCPAKTTKE